MKRIIAFLLCVLLLGCMLAGCRTTPQKALIGKWKAEADLAMAYETMLAKADPAMTGHIDIQNFTIEVFLTFNEDGTYAWTVNDTHMRLGSKNMRNAISSGLSTYLQIETGMPVDQMLAASGKTMDELMDECAKLLHEGDWFYEEDMITDQPQRQIAAEVIREKILRTLDKEIPHGVAVVIEEYRDEGGLVRIRAEIFCEKASHKGILVGKNGETLKRIGSYAREDLEKMLEAQVYLNLWVKVKENWRDSQRGITDFGFTED